MRNISWWLLTGLTLMALGCGGGSTSPLAPADTSAPLPPASTPIPGAVSGQGALGTAYQTGLNTESALAIYTIDIDSAALTATAHLKETRAAQANDDLYLLSIDSFLTASSFQITGVSATATTIDLTYSVAHPFPAASPGTGTPNGSTNRADLGVAGMVLFLADVPAAAGNTYFTDRVANTELVVNADAYYSPAGLISVTGTANTFPYRQLVDETTGGTGSRVGQSNSGNTGGNFGSDGWTRAEWGAGNDAWTGFGVLHQGQTSTNTLSLDRAALAGGFSLDTAVIAKYNDPRGGANATQKKANRLPPTGPDATLFAYRMPHGALDVQKIEFGGESGGFFTNTISASTLNFRVEDWDARATESAEVDLALDASFTNVAQGESGLPAIDVCIPGVLGDATTVVAMTTVVDDDTAMGGDAAQDSGAAGDGILFSEAVTKTVTSGQADGTFTGLVRATDPETGLVVPLDATTLLPLSSNLPEPVTYQAFTVDQTTPNAPPTATVDGPVAAVASGNGVLTLTVSAYNDPDSDPISIQFDWNDDGDYLDPGEGLQVLDGTPPDSFNSPIFYNNATLVPSPRNVDYQYTDGVIGTPLTGSVGFTLGPNQAPQVTGTRALASASLPTPASFTMNAGTGTATDPEGDAITYTITNNRNGDQPTFGAFPNAANTTAITNPPNATVAFTVYANDALHATTSGTTYPVVNGTITPAGPPAGWVYNPLVSTTGQELVRSMIVDGAGNILITGTRSTTTSALDFGGGPRPIVSTSSQNFLVKLDSNGTYVWDRVWGGTSSFIRPFSVDYDNSNNIYLSGTMAGTMVISGLGGGATDQTTPSTASEDYYLLKFDSNGNYLALARTTDAIDSFGSSAPTGASISSTVYGAGPRSLAVNRTTGDVFMTGGANNAGTIDWGSGVTQTLAGGRSAILVKFNSSLIPQWGVDLATAPTNSNSQFGITVALDPGGNPYVGGSFATAIDLGAGSTPVVGGQDAFFVGRDASTGALIPGSIRIIASSATGSEQISNIAIDSSRIYVHGGWGSAAAQTLTLGAPLPAMVAGGTSQMFVGAYTLANVPVWQQSGTGTSYNIAANMAVSATDIYVGGHYANATCNWGYGTMPLVTASDLALAKYDKATGALTGYARTWNSAGTTGTEWGTSVATTAAGDPIFAGQWGATTTLLDWDPGAGVENRTSVGGGDIFVVKLIAGTGTF